MQLYIRIAALLGFTAVVLGAFGAHTLKNILPEAQLHSFEVGVRYQFYHVLALLAVVLLSFQFPQKNLQPVALLMSLGVLLFSGSIYLLACREPLGIGQWKWLGPLTPIGGMLFVIAWGWLFWVFWRE